MVNHDIMRFDVPVYNSHAVAKI